MAVLGYAFTSHSAVGKHCALSQVDPMAHLLIDGPNDQASARALRRIRAPNGSS
jgi:hypothetical protein